MTTSFYVGPNRPPLRVASWGELVAAAQAGALTETQWVELKAALPPAAREPNLELARDLASLSVDGGTLIIGVRDPGTAGEDVAGTVDDVENLRERVSQVAGSTRVQPSLNVELTTLRHPADQARHVLLVAVPASAQAPHMVDDRYWGRSATGKRTLTNDEASRLWAIRRAAHDDFEQRGRSRPQELDHLWPTRRRLGWAQLLIEPAAPGATSWTSDNAPDTTTVINAPSFQAQWPLNFRHLTNSRPHPEGVAWTSFRPDMPADSRTVEEGIFLLITDVGAIRIIAPSTFLYGHEQKALCISVNALMELVHQALDLAAHLASEHLGYGGAWKAGLHLEGLAGIPSTHALGSNLSGHASTAFPQDTYTRSTTVSREEIATRPAAVVEELLSGVARGLGLRRLFPYQSPGDIARRV